MSTDSDSSVIRKKALSGREDFDARAMSWSKAMRLSLERVSDRLFGLQISVRMVEQVDQTLADLKEVASGDRLVMLLDTYGEFAVHPAQNAVSRRGAAILDRGLVQTLVEVQTRGCITQAELEERPFTRTDAAVTSQLIDPVLASVDEMMMETPQRPEPLRLRYGDKVEDARALLLALEAPDYVLFRITLDIEDGDRSGAITLAIPDEMLRPPPPAPDPEEADAGGFDLSGTALSSPVALNAIVARLNMPLAKVWTLKPGDTLPVERDALTRTELVGSKGFVLGKVALGQMGGMRAVRLGPGEAEDTTEPASPLAELTAADQATALSDRHPSQAVTAQTSLPTLGLPALDLDGPAGLSDAATEPQNDLVDPVDEEVDLSDLSLPSLDTDAPLNLPEDVADMPPDALGLGDLADLSGLDDATLAPSEDDLPGLPDLPGL